MFKKVKKTTEAISEVGARRQFAITLTGALLLSSSIGIGTYKGMRNTVNLEVAGYQQEVRTHASTVADLLAEQDIIVEAHDKVEPSKATEITGDMEVNVQFAKQVNLDLDGEEEQVWTIADTVAEFLEEQEITITDHDVVKPMIDIELEEDMDIQIEKAFQVILDVAGEEEELWSIATTIENFLEENEIEVKENDRVEPAMEEMVPSDDTIRVIRVETTTDVVEESISFETRRENDPNLEKGTEEVIESGENGVKELTFEVTKENGEEVAREEISSEVVKESTDRVIAVGTKEPVQETVEAPAPQAQEAPQPAPKAETRQEAAPATQAAPAPQAATTSEPDLGTVEGRRVVRKLTVESTAYSVAQAGSGGMTGVTATGIDLRANPNKRVIAVDPSVIPLGTTVWVEGYGVAIAGDTGGAIRGNKIDVHVPTVAEAIQWGRRNVTVKILA